MVHLFTVVRGKVYSAALYIVLDGPSALHTRIVSYLGVLIMGQFARTSGVTTGVTWYSNSGAPPVQIVRIFGGLERGRMQQFSDDVRKSCPANSEE